MTTIQQNGRTVAYVAMSMIRVNGVVVASEKFPGKVSKKVSQMASHWISDTEYIIRSTLQASGCESAIFETITDNLTIRYQWTRNEDSTYGLMKCIDYTDTEEKEQSK